MNKLPPVDTRRVPGRKTELGPFGTSSMMDPNFYLPVTVLLVIVAVLAVYFSLDKPNDANLAKTSNLPMSVTSNGSTDVINPVDVTFGVAGSGVSFTVELEARIQDPVPLVIGVELQAPVDASEVEQARTRFLNGLMAGNVEVLAVEGLWFQNHALETYTVEGTTVSVEDVRTGLVAVLDNLARFPQSLHLVATTAKGPTNPGLNVQSIDWLAVSIQGLEALGALEESQSLKNDAIVALSTAHMASQSPENVPSTSPVPVPESGVNTESLPSPEQPVLPEGVQSTSEVGVLPEIPLENLTQSMGLPLDLDPKTWNFSPLSILSGIRDLFDLIRGNPQIKYWVVVGNETTSPNLVRMMGGLLPSFELNYVTLQGYYENESVAGSPIVFLQFWLGPPPYEIGDKLEVNSLLNIVLDN